MMEMNTEAKIKMWKEDLGWLLEQPRTLERDHVAEVLKHDIQTFEETIAANDSAYVRRLNRELIEQAAKIAELQQSATTLRQLEELLRDGWTVVYRIMRDAPVFFVYHQNHLVNPDEFCESTLPAAIAAAWERKEE